MSADKRPLQARSFVIRLAPSQAGEWHGQASEPGSADAWRVTFDSLGELWADLQDRLADPPPNSPAPGAQL